MAQGICSVNLPPKEGNKPAEGRGWAGAGAGLPQACGSPATRKTLFPGHHGITSHASSLLALYPGITPCMKLPYSLASSCPIHLGCLEGRLTVEK